MLWGLFCCERYLRHLVLYKFSKFSHTQIKVVLKYSLFLPLVLWSVQVYTSSFLHFYRENSTQTFGVCRTKLGNFYVKTTHVYMLNQVILNK